MNGDQQEQEQQETMDLDPQRSSSQDSYTKSPSVLRSSLRRTPQRTNNSSNNGGRGRERGGINSQLFSPSTIGSEVDTLTTDVRFNPTLVTNIYPAQIPDEIFVGVSSKERGSTKNSNNNRTDVLFYDKNEATSPQLDRRKSPKKRWSSGESVTSRVSRMSRFSLESSRSMMTSAVGMILQRPFLLLMTSLCAFTFFCLIIVLSAFSVQYWRVSKENAPTIIEIDGSSSLSSSTSSSVADGSVVEQSNQPSLEPSVMSSDSPSHFPSIYPSYLPSSFPSVTPTYYPSTLPSYEPSNFLSAAPSSYPSEKPSIYKTLIPTQKPSNIPTKNPTPSPTIKTTTNTFEPTAGTPIPTTFTPKPTRTPSAGPPLTPYPFSHQITFFPTPFTILETIIEEILIEKPPTTTTGTNNQEVVNNNINHDGNSENFFPDTFPPLETVQQMVSLLENRSAPGRYKRELSKSTLIGSSVHIYTDSSAKAIIIRIREHDSNVNNFLFNYQTTKGKPGPTLNPLENAGLVHTGFNIDLFAHDLYEDIEEEVLEEIEDEPSYELIVTGHAKGGSAAILLGAYMSKRLPVKKNIRVIAFGSPRVGDLDFHKWVERRENLSLWLIVYQDDLFSRLPKSMQLIHTGHLLYLDPTKTKIQAYYQHRGECDMGYKGIPDEWKDGDSLTDHSFEKYVSYFATRQSLLPSSYYDKKFETGTCAEGRGL